MSVSMSDIEAAAARIRAAVRRTPLLNDEAIDAELGCRLFVKAESLQAGGAFKLRGAMNALASLDPATRGLGVVAFSSGNHAIAVARAAKRFRVPAVIVMPADAPAAKRSATRAAGAEVVLYDRLTQSREAIGAEISEARGLHLVRPFDDPDVIAGQGTCGLEIAEDLEAAGVSPDAALVCASGGGLCAGVAVALQARFPGVAIHPVEPEGHNDLARSLASGRIEVNPPGVRSICDALLVERMGEHPFAILQDRAREGLTVSDAAVLRAMAFAALRLRLVLEPGGAAALAALLERRDAFAGRTVVVVASGGNVDGELLQRALEAAAAA